MVYEKSGVGMSSLDRGVLIERMSSPRTVISGNEESDYDRRTDQVRAACVERGVDVLKLDGEHAAVVVLRTSEVPEHVILRVVSSAGFRRKRI